MFHGTACGTPMGMVDGCRPWVTVPGGGGVCGANCVGGSGRGGAGTGTATRTKAGSGSGSASASGEVSFAGARIGAGGE
jgi:hypothetical protein